MTGISVTAFIQIANMVSRRRGINPYANMCKHNRSSVNEWSAEWMSWNILLHSFVELRRD